MSVQIRPAIEADFDFVVSLMDEALSPYYGGDHRSHARRIFDTHVSGGRDRMGFFSMEQCMFVAESEGERTGMVHLVLKRQGTVKISPLIVSKTHRSGQGVGTALLQHGETFARERNARTIYCTVALQNTGAYQFFLRRGFTPAGRSPSHYKDGVTEIMMYKFLKDAPADVFDRDHISVLPMEQVQEAQVRELLLKHLPEHFMEIDDDWISNLFAGYSRRHTKDINQKFKLIYTATDRQNVVRGVAGATPKKGEPIKLMPLVATDDPAFFALLSDVPQRLAEFGRKVYVHIVPTSRQTRFLQRGGWTLDGALPEAYQLGVITQQWSLSTDVVSKMQTIRLKQKYLDYIRDGKKTLEVRVGYSSVRKLRSGEQLNFLSKDDSLLVFIKSIRTYPSFTKMLEQEDYRKIVPDQGRSGVEALLRQIYRPDKERLGVYVFEVEPVRQKF
jgi:ASC-1-like (ASCH) protein/ribosomal protein S18 acetylase RimI-like enzyme